MTKRGTLLSGAELFNGWTREGYWKNGVLHHGKLGREIYQEPTFATPEPALVIEPVFAKPAYEIPTLDAWR